MLILHVPIPLHLHERLWLKAAWQLLCLPPLFSSSSPALPCCTTAPCSTPFSSALLLMEEGEGESSASLCGFILKSPSMARAAADDQKPISPPWRTGLRCTLSYSQPRGSWQGGSRGCSPAESCPGCRARVRAGMLPALHPPFPASLCDCSEPLHLRESRSTSSSGTRPHPGIGHGSFPVPWDMQPSGTRQHSCDTRKISKLNSLQVSAPSLSSQSKQEFQQPPSPSRQRERPGDRWF